MDEYIPPARRPLDHALRSPAADDFFGALGADIRFGGASAFYDPLADCIQLPEYRHFRDAAAFYATLSHETCHHADIPIMPH